MFPLFYTFDISYTYFSNDAFRNEKRIWNFFLLSTITILSHPPPSPFIQLAGHPVHLNT